MKLVIFSIDVCPELSEIYNAMVKEVYDRWMIRRIKFLTRTSIIINTSVKETDILSMFTGILDRYKIEGRVFVFDIENIPWAIHLRDNISEDADLVNWFERNLN